jgi:hypothetical protein
MTTTKTADQRKAKVPIKGKTPQVNNSDQAVEVTVEPDHLRITIRLSKHSDPLLFNEVASVAAFHRTHRLVRLAATGLLAEGMINSRHVLSQVEKISNIDTEFLAEMIKQKKEKQARKAGKKIAMQTEG